MSDAYNSLVALNQEITLIGTTASTLGWDQETYMPEGAIAHRSKQLAYLSGKAHELRTSDQYRSLLESCEDETHLNPTIAANIREWRHHFDRATKLPKELVERNSETTSLAKPAWAKARKDNNFAEFAPHLHKLLDLAREKAELWGYEDEKYDALLSGYERGAKTSDIAAIFDQFQPGITQLAKEAVEKCQANPARTIDGNFPVEQQQILNREVAESIGFDFNNGRIDTTTHPFCTTLGPQDVRLTTRYYPNDFTASLFGVMHETGHGLYEQGLPASEFGLPSGNSVSLGIHESQSLLWEAHVGRSRSFWNRWFPRAQELFDDLKDWSLEEFLYSINQAKYSFIRVDADEATYDLHILLRFNLERRLLNGDITVEEVPDAWNALFQEMFGLTPPSDTKGCLQDIHWSMGGLGYFPTYTMGNLNASQLFNAAIKDSSIKTAYEAADFKPLLDWMRREIHSKGSTLLPQELMKSASGETTNPEYHLAHLKKRFIDRA
ncbi:carboxypeptidase Taq [Rubritalea squalenifaciens DSM 18772]|uniref:Metal-dependent carboxypeptidase n=1 Tax=Rubritalea squalenifaciens DSM 18772 TaxID=1123071 RepID=A0A1M6R3L7_9BACT|nr:carboxypeptidase M32 [Rubritalea squalenifaciens]SHK26918.1 carboxypeptidase Taq [Rubritalea squalenifaciens DSM 18772]